MARDVAPGEPLHPEAAATQIPVAHPVAVEPFPSAMHTPAVDLDDELQLRPAEVDSVRPDLHLPYGPREALLTDNVLEPVLQLGLRQSATVSDLGDGTPELPTAATAAHGRQSGHIEIVVHLGTLQGALDLSLRGKVRVIEKRTVEGRRWDPEPRGPHLVIEPVSMRRDLVTVAAVRGRGDVDLRRRTLAASQHRRPQPAMGTDHLVAGGVDAWMVIEDRVQPLAVKPQLDGFAPDPFSRQLPRRYDPTLTIREPRDDGIDGNRVTW